MLLLIFFTQNSNAVNYEYGYKECYKDLGVAKSVFYDGDDINQQKVIAYKDNQEKNYCSKVLGTEDYSWDSQLCSDRRYIVSDAIGMEKVCRTKFPTWGERFIFTRTGTTNSDLSFNLELAYCDVRNIFAEWAPCDMGFGSRSRTSFSLDEVANYNQGGVKKRIAQHQVCVKRISNGEKIYEEDGGKVWNGKWPVFCAYVNILNCNNYLINSKHALIGCLETPIPDGPGVFNPVKPFGIIAYVDPFTMIEDSVNPSGVTLTGLKRRGSKFDKPKIVLTHGLGQSDYLELTFDYTQASYFSNAAENPSCKTFSDTTTDNLIYCAKPHPTDQSKVCACIKGTDCASDFVIGCAPRPTPEQSGYRIVATYKDFIVDASATPPVTAPSVVPMFVEMTTAGDLIYVNSSNNLAYKGSDNKFYQVDPVTKQRTPNQASGQFIDYKTMQMPNPLPQAREFYKKRVGSGDIYQRDLIKIYGVEFAAMIPKIDSSGKPIYRRISSAYYEPENKRGCTNVSFCEGPTCAPDSVNFSLSRSFFVPEGARDNSLCTNASNPIVYPSKPCDLGTPAHDQAAINILCPGILNERPGGMKICLENFSGWDFISQDDQICANIPATCEEIKEPTAASGFAVWPKMDAGTEMEGECDVSYGFTTAKNIYLTKPLVARPSGVGAPDYDEYKSMYSQWESIQWNHSLSSGSLGVEANSEYIRNYINNFLATKTGKSQAYYDMFPTVGKDELKPKRQCTTSGQSVITNPCVKKQGCPSITKPFTGSGFGVWSSATPFSGSDLYFINLAMGTTTQRLQLGSCQSPYRNSGLTGPMRDCVVVTGSAPFSMTQTYQSVYWADVRYPCIK